MTFNLNLAIGLHGQAITNPTIDGHPVIAASIRHAGFSSIATVSTAVDGFQNVDCHNEWKPSTTWCPWATISAACGA